MYTCSEDEEVLCWDRTYFLALLLGTRAVGLRAEGRHVIAVCLAPRAHVRVPGEDPDRSAVRSVQGTLKIGRRLGGAADGGRFDAVATLRSGSPETVARSSSDAVPFLRPVDGLRGGRRSCDGVLVSAPDLDVGATSERLLRTATDLTGAVFARAPVVSCCGRGSEEV